MHIQMKEASIIKHGAVENECFNSTIMHLWLWVMPRCRREANLCLTDPFPTHYNN